MFHVVVLHVLPTLTMMHGASCSIVERIVEWLQGFQQVHIQ